MAMKKIIFLLTVLTYEKYGCKHKNLNYIWDEKYYYKSQPPDYQYVIWHNGIWKFTLLHTMERMIPLF